jgi:hypothetical protein
MEEEEYDLSGMSLKDLKSLESLTTTAIQHYKLTLDTPSLTDTDKWQFERCIFYTEQDLFKIQEEIKKRTNK